MHMTRTGLDDCCASAVFSRLGNAHGHPRASSFEEFATRLMQLGYMKVNVAVTNSGQTFEEEYLKKCGFKLGLETTGTAFPLKVWVATNKDIEAALVPIKAEMEKKLKEEQEKKRLEQERLRIQREEEARRQQERKKQKLIAELREKAKNSKKFDKPITGTDVKNILGGEDKPRSMTLGKYLETIYDLKTPIRGYTAGCTSTLYFYNSDYASLAKSVNKRLKDEGRLL